MNLDLIDHLTQRLHFEVVSSLIDKKEALAVPQLQLLLSSEAVS